VATPRNRAVAPHREPPSLHCAMTGLPGRQGQGSRRERAVFPVLADGSAMVARIAPPRGITEQSMRQATRRAERHVAQLLGRSASPPASAPRGT